MSSKHLRSRFLRSPLRAAQRRLLGAAFFSTALAFFAAVPAFATTVTFPSGSLIIPMDTTYQNYGMFKAYGLVYALLQNGVPISWSIAADKAYGEVDFTATTRDDRTKAAIGSYAYSGGPFVVDASDPTALEKAQAVIAAWWAANGNQPVVHEATASFSANVDIRLTTAPRIAVDQVNSAIAIDYFNAAGIPDLNGNLWSAASPNILSETMIACGNATSCTGDTTIGNSALFQAGACTKKNFDIFVTPHNSGYAYSLSDPSNLGTQYYAELDYFVYQGGGWIALCHSILSNENYIADLYLHSEPAVRALFKSTAAGGFLTKYGFPAIDNKGGTFTVNPVTADLPIAQAVPTTGAQSLPGGSVQTWHEPVEGSTAYVQYWDATERIAYFTASGVDYDFALNGVYHNGTGRGKMTFLGGHHYTTSVPYLSNTEAPYLRFFYNALFYNGSAVANLNLVVTPDPIPQGTTTPIQIALRNTGASDAMDVQPVTMTLQPGVTYVGTTGVQPASVVAGPGGTTILTFNPPTSPWNIPPGSSPIVVNATYFSASPGTFRIADLTTNYYGDVFGEGFTANTCMSLTVSPTPGASITKTPATVGPVNVGDVVTWTLTYRNPGSANLLNPWVEDVLPSAFTFTSASPAPTYTVPVPGGTRVRWTLPSPLAPGASGTITLRAVVQTAVGQPFTNTVTFSGTDALGNAYTATASSVVTVNAPVASLGKAVSPAGAVNAGDTLTYSLSPSSSGTTLFNGIRFFDAPPLNTTYKAASVTQGGTYGPYVPIAAVDGDDPGPSPSTLVHISAGASPYTYALGDTVTLTMTLTNRDLPGGYTIHSATPTALLPSDGLSTCSGPSPASASVPVNGGTATFTFTCTIGSLAEVTWEGGASGTYNGSPYDFPSATSNSVLGVSTATGTNVVQWLPATNTNTPGVPSMSYAPGTSPGLFAFNGSTDLWERYDIANNAWITSPAGLTNNLPATAGDGAALVYDGNGYANGYVYALRGGGTPTFWRYKLSDGTAGTWSTVNGAPWNVGAGGALTRLGGYLYALRGGNTTGFARYDLATGTWTDLTPTAPVPAAVNAGGALATDGTYVYAVRGGGKNNFYRYDPGTNAWTAMANAPWGIGAGGALTSIGTTIYCLRGNSNNFAKFVPNATTGKWTKLANAPGTAKAGGALATDGTTIWALQGDGKKGFWAYSPAANAWTTKAATLANITTGGALCWVPGSSGATNTNALSAPVLVTGTSTSPASIQVVQTLTSSTAVSGITPGPLTVSASSNATSGTACTASPAPPQSIAAGGTLVFTWTCPNVYATGTTQATTLGSLTFSAGATGTSPATTWTAATSNSVLVARPMTYQVTVNTSPADFMQVTNVGMMSDSLAFANGVGSNSVVTPINRPPRLVVTKSVVPASGTSVLPGATLAYTLSVLNTSAGQATSVVVTDVIPPYTTYAGTCGVIGGTVNTCSYDGTKVTFTVGTLAGYGSATLTMNVTASTPTYAGIYTIPDTANFTYTGTGGPFSGSSNTVENTLLARPAPTISKAESVVPPPDENGLIVPGSTITYTLTVRNPAGAVTAQSVVATDPVPAGTTYVAGSCTTTQGTCSEASRLVTWTIGTMAPNTAVTITFQVTVDTPAVNGSRVDNGAEVSAATNIPGTTYSSPSNIVSYTIKAAPILSVVKTVSPPDGTPVEPGQTLTYTLTIRNTGDASATTAYVSDAIPAWATYVAGSTTLNGVSVLDELPGISPVENHMLVYSPGHADPGGDGGQLLPEPPTSNDAIVTFQVRAASPAVDNGTHVTNTATTGSSTTPPVESNQVDNPIFATPNVTIEKTHDPTGSVDPLTEILYTIRVTNELDANHPSIGGMTATNLTVTDPLSPYAVYVAGSAEAGDPAGSYDPGTHTVTWTGLTLEPGQWVDLTFRVYATDTWPSGNYTIVNVARTSYRRYAAWNDAGTVVPLESSVSNQLSIPTEVKLRDLRVVQDGRNILLTWQTSVEADNLGFNVWREENGTRTRVNAKLIAGNAFMVRGQSPRAGSAYRLRDTVPSADSFVRYWLEAVDLRGRSTFHEPTSWTAGPVVDDGNTVPLAGLGADQTLESEAGYGFVQPDALPAPTSQRVQTQHLMAGAAGLKVFVSREGWYRISRAQMTAAGYDPGRNAGAISVASSGISQPIVVNTGKDRFFDPDDTLEFYALGLDTPSTGARTYWLQAVAAPKRLGGGNARTSTPFTGSVPFTYHRDERSIYAANVTNTGEGENFFGTIITADPVTVGVPVGAIDPTFAGDARLEIVLQGGLDAVDHGVGVSVNGHPAGEISFAYMDQPTFRADFPQSWLAPGENAITLRALGGDWDVSAIVSVRLTYRHLLVADVGLLEAAFPAGSTATVEGFPSRLIRALDVTDPLAPAALAVKVGGRGPYTATFTTPASPGPRTVLIFSDERTLPIPDASPNSPSSWSNAAGRGADLVILTNGAFGAAAAALASARTAAGLRTAVVDVEDVYDERNFGVRSPQAIRDFLLSTREWSPAPRWVVLLGDASLDPRNYLEAGSFDFVPTRFTATQEMKTAFDDWFTDFDDDGIADVPIGRLSARTADEASAVVAKILSRGSPSGDWAGRALLVADVSDTYDFAGAATSLAPLFPSTVTPRTIVRGTPGFDVVGSLNAGQLLVDYVGHGSVELWRDSLDSTAAMGLTNGTKLPFVVSLTCLNGFFQDVYTTSLAEAFMKAPGGGAFAVWASSTLTSPEDQIAMNQELLRGLFAPTPLTLGEAVAKAKAAATNPDVRKSWILFGDPSMTLR